MSRNNRTTTNTDVFAGLSLKAGPTEGGRPLEEASWLPIKMVEPNPDQPRKKSDPDKDKDLAADIGERGILQPIIVRPLPGKTGHFQIVAGERRWRAANQAGLEEVPVIIKEGLDDKEIRLISLVENLQRLDLDLQDEATFFQLLSKEYNFSNRQISRMINRSPGYVNDRINLAEGRLTPPDQTINTPTPAPQAAPVRERPRPQPKLWNYRPQTFQRLRTYINETLENWEQVEDDKSRTALLKEVSTLKEELARLEQKLHTKPRR